MSARFIWQRQPEELRGHLEHIAKNRALDLAKKIFDGIVARTPVYTGTARANWVASVNQPARVMIVHTDPNNPLPAPTFQLHTLPKGSKVIISNMTPYIVELEYGSSHQAPQGMVRVTLASLGVQLGVRQ